jgi:hypothetical protein
MMKFLKVALLLNLALISNIGHALEIPDVDIRVDSLRGALTLPPNGQIQVTGFQQFNSGAIISVSSTPENWSVLNRVHDNAEIRLINGGDIKLTSPGSIVLSGSAIPDTRISLSASAVPEAETYLLLLAGLGLIGAIIRRRKAQ